jgi:hypothetical protein
MHPKTFLDLIPENLGMWVNPWGIRNSAADGTLQTPSDSAPVTPPVTTVPYAHLIGV